jgi:hypothetical protein
MTRAERHEFELAPCHARSPLPRGFAFYLADPISAVHEFTRMDAAGLRKKYEISW